MGEWWALESTRIKDILNDDRGIATLHGTMINGIWEYVIVFWSNGVPSLNLHFREGIVLFDIGKVF